MTVRVVILTLLSLGVVAGPRAGDRPPRIVSVAIEGLRFTPETVSVAVGDTVVWDNRDIVPHTVTWIAGEWTSGLMDTGDTSRWIASAPGELGYRCDYHPTMRGIIRIR